MLRSTERKKVLWSPHQPNLFVVGGNDLRLYQIRTPSNSSNSELDDGPRHFSVLPPTEASPSEKKSVSLCFDWCLDPRERSLIAAGLATGRVVLVNMDNDGEMIKKEFTPRQMRTCNAVAWNPFYKNLLAAGLDKVRSDFSCLIWDINEGSASNIAAGGGLFDDPGHAFDFDGSASASASSTPLLQSNTTSTSYVRDNVFNLSTVVATEKIEKPAGQFANSEAIASLAWLPNAPGCLATGTGNRWLRIYDMRDTMKPMNSVGAHPTKAIHGVCFDPHREHCLATFSEESIIKIWDTRMFKDPVMQLTVSGSSANNKIVQIGWCPSRGAGLLAAIAKDESFVRVWNVNSGMMIQDDSVAKLMPASGATLAHSASTSSQLASTSSTASKASGSTSTNKQSVSTSVTGALNITPGIPGGTTGASAIVSSGSSNSISGSKDPKSTALWATCDLYFVGNHPSIAHPSPSSSSTGVAGSIAQGASAILSGQSPLSGGSGGSGASNEHVSGFAWHPTKGQLLTITSNSLVELLNLHEPIAISFSSQSRICFSVQKSLVEGNILLKPSSSLPSLDDSSPVPHIENNNTNKNSNNKTPTSATEPNNVNHEITSNLNSAPLHSTQANSPVIDMNVEIEEALKGNRDISLVMMQRAIRGYGGDSKENKQIVASFGNPELEYVWGWLNDMKYNLAKKAGECKGIYSIIMSQSKSALLSGSPNEEGSSSPSTATPESTPQESKSSTTTTQTSTNPSSGNPSKSTSPLPFQISALSQLKQKYPSFSSQDRIFCLKMCGWGFQSPEELAKEVDILYSKGNVCKAIALAVFHLDISLALSTLKSVVNSIFSGNSNQSSSTGTGGSSNQSKSNTNSAALNGNPSIQHDQSNSSQSNSLQPITHASDFGLMTLALAGFVDANSSLSWRASCEPLRPQIIDTYLNAALSFLCSDAPDYWKVLYETEISLCDKLAFACRYLDDEKLGKYLELTKVQVVGQGRLTGLLLTGIDSVGGGIDLLQNYIDRTSDIQTPALLLSHVSSRKIKDPRNRVNLWTHMYRQLLDRWGLWNQRAKFDVARGEANPPPHVMARCNFCNASFTLGRDNVQVKAPITMGRMGPSVGLASQGSPMMKWSDKKKITCCPSCRKPMPRCALCLLPLVAIPPTPDNRSIGEGLQWTSPHQNVDDWFSWCQNCKHGGHAGHLLEWFRHHSVCPVSDCDCKCAYS